MTAGDSAGSILPGFVSIKAILPGRVLLAGHISRFLQSSPRWAQVTSGGS